MVIWDDRIMEILFEEGTGTATKLSEREEIRVSRPHISNRLTKLKENNLLKHLGNGVYTLSNEGVGYLQEKYDAEVAEWAVGEEVDEEVGVDSEAGDMYMRSIKKESFEPNRFTEQSDQVAYRFEDVMDEVSEEEMDKKE